MKKYKRMPSKIVSAFMAFIFIALSVPFAFAAEPIALTASNVTKWPSISFVNGDTMFFGQTVGDGVIINDDEVVTDGNGNEVSGRFVFIDENEIPTGAGSVRTNIKFVPDNTSEYTGFEAKRCRNVTFAVSKTTPKYVDEINDPLVASAVEKDSTLSNSILSGGAVTNEYNATEPKLLKATWSWRNSSTIVTESGFYEAYIVATGYNELVAQVWVQVAGDAVETTVSELPTVSDLTYTPGLKWQDVSLAGGKAVASGTETEIVGTFSHSMRGDITAGSHTIDVTFTPDDITTAKSTTCQITVTVNKAPIKFVDENGNEIVPEITVPYGTKFNDISRLLLPYVKGADYTLLSMGDLEYKQCEEGTYTIIASAPSDSENYEATEVTFKIVIEKIKINPSLKERPGEMYIEDNSAVYKPKGTFTIEYTIDGVEQTPITGIKYNTHFEWNPTKSGNYEYTVIYNEAEENEYFIIDDFTTSDPVKLMWSFSATGMNTPVTYTYGDTVTHTAPAIDETRKDKPYYVFSEWSEVKGIEMTDEQKSNPEVSFTMPDNDVELKANYKFSFKAFLEWIWAKIVQFFTFIINAVKDLIALAAA